MGLFNNARQKELGFDFVIFKGLTALTLMLRGWLPENVNSTRIWASSFFSVISKWGICGKGTRFQTRAQAKMVLILMGSPLHFTLVMSSGFMKYTFRLFSFQILGQLTGD